MINTSEDKNKDIDIPDWWVMDGVKVVMNSDDWWFTDMTEDEFVEFYNGTEVMNILHLFRTPPKSDTDYIENYVSSALFREVIGIKNYIVMPTPQTGETQ